MKATGVAVLTICFTIFETILNGFVLKVLWGWFVSDTFGVQRINIPQALGLALVVSFLTYRHQEDERSFAEMAVSSLLMVLFFFALGWVYHLFL